MVLDFVVFEPQTRPPKGLANHNAGPFSCANLQPTASSTTGPLCARKKAGPTVCMLRSPRTFWSREEGQDVAEYAVMLAVILIIIIGTIRLIGGNANNVFSSVASSVQ